MATVARGNARAPRAGSRRPAQLAGFFQGLADPIRVEILAYLADAPKTAGEIVRHVGRPQATVSSHLACLRFCGYVEARRQGRKVEYALLDPRIRTLLSIGQRYLRDNAERITSCRVIAAERDSPKRTNR